MNGKPPREALLAYIDHYLSATHCAARNTGCPIAALGSDIPRLDDETRAAFARGMERQHQRIAAQLQLLGTRMPISMARSMRSEMFGALLSARLVGGEAREEILETSRARVVEAVSSGNRSGGVRQGTCQIDSRQVRLAAHLHSISMASGHAVRRADPGPSELVRLTPPADSHARPAPARAACATRPRPAPFSAGPAPAAGSPC